MQLNQLPKNCMITITTTEEKEGQARAEQPTRSWRLSAWSTRTCSPRNSNRSVISTKTSSTNSSRSSRLSLASSLPLSAKSKQIDALSLRTTELERNNETLKREKDKSDKKAEKAVELARTLEKDLRSEREISKGLMDRLEKTKESEEGLKAQVVDLQEQVSDLMFFVQARDKLDQEGGEAQGGDVEMRAKPERKGKGRRR